MMCSKFRTSGELSSIEFEYLTGRNRFQHGRHVCRPPSPIMCLNFLVPVLLLAALEPNLMRDVINRNINTCITWNFNIWCISKQWMTIY